MSTYYNKYQKYKKKYLDLKYKNIGCDRMEGTLPEYLVNLFERNTAFFKNNNEYHKSINGTMDNYRIKKMLDCSISQIIHSGILKDISEVNINKIVLIDGTNLMRNRWFITFALSIVEDKYVEMIKRSFFKYVEEDKDQISFDDEIEWFREIIIIMINKLSEHDDNIYIVCIQKTIDDKYKKNKINNSELYWLPIDCFSSINNKQVLCIRDATFKFKNEADDFALILLYLYFCDTMFPKLNKHDTYLLSGDGYDWFTGIKPDRLTIYITDNIYNENTLNYRLNLQKNNKPVNNIISYKLYHDGNVYDDDNSDFDIYYKYMILKKNKSISF